jgi:hypothetical protein
MPPTGVSMMYTFNNETADSMRETQYFEMLGNQGIYHDGWTAQTTPIAAPWVGTAPEADTITGYKWELYHVDEDPTQSKNLAEECPAKLAGECVCALVCVFASGRGKRREWKKRRRERRERRLYPITYSPTYSHSLSFPIALSHTLIHTQPCVISLPWKPPSTMSTPLTTAVPLAWMSPLVLL